MTKKDPAKERIRNAIYALRAAAEALRFGATETPSVPLDYLPPSWELALADDEDLDGSWVSTTDLASKLEEIAQELESEV